LQKQFINIIYLLTNVGLFQIEILIIYEHTCIVNFMKSGRTGKMILLKYLSKNLDRYRFENNFVDHQNNYVKGNSNLMNNAVNNFNILAISLSVLIILMVPTKLFSDLYLSKFWDASAKSFVFILNISGIYFLNVLIYLFHMLQIS